MVRSGAGLVAATLARDQFRADLGGGTTAGANGSFGGIRREINWDGVPDAFAAPNNFPSNFFNVNSPRGAVFSTTGAALQVSATAGSGTPVRFGNIDPSYPSTFTTFSPERLFGVLDDGNPPPAIDVSFFVPGTTTPATVSGFGAMFTDDDGAVSLEFFGPNGEDLGTIFGAPASGDVSFLGLSFDAGERIGRVRIRPGNVGLGSGNNDGGGSPFPPGFIFDVVAMDDLIYSEPAAAPAIPTASRTTLLALTVCLAALAAIRLRL